MNRAVKSYIRDCISIVFPRLWYRILRSKTYRSYRVVNDLTIYPQLSLPYDPASTYVTMFKTPPRHYGKINASRRFDSEGIPLYQDKYYNLVQIAQYGLTEFGYYKNTGKKEHLENARKVCEWLLNNQEPNTGYWVYHFEFYHRATEYTLKDWACAMGQGQAASFLTRMWRIDQDDRYLEAARNAFNMFDVPVADGGLLAEFHGYKMYEEYPTDPASFTLNGMIFATFGLYDYLQLRKDEHVQLLFDEAIKSLEYMLPLYDDDLASNYDISHITARKIPKVKGDKYHIIHINLLQNLESIAPHPTFEYYIRKWAKISGFVID